MSAATPQRVDRVVITADDEEQFLADSTPPAACSVRGKLGLDTLFRDAPDVLVASNLPWYPVEEDLTICLAPHILVAFGRTKVRRASYKQWKEGHTAPQVVFDFPSGAKRFGETVRKVQLYQRHGVEEVYVYDPGYREVSGWLRKNGVLENTDEMQGWVSPRLRVRFAVIDGELHLYGPDGQLVAPPECAR